MYDNIVTTKTPDPMPEGSRASVGFEKSIGAFFTDRPIDRILFIPQNEQGDSGMMIHNVVVFFADGTCYTLGSVEANIPTSATPEED
jgi:hypothetical protein